MSVTPWHRLEALRFGIACQMGARGVSIVEYADEVVAWLEKEDDPDIAVGCLRLVMDFGVGSAKGLGALRQAKSYCTYAKSPSQEGESTSPKPSGPSDQRRQREAPRKDKRKRASAKKS